MYRGKKVYIGVWCYLWFYASFEGHGMCPPWIRENYCTFLNFLLDCQALSFDSDLDVCVKLKVIKILSC